VLSPDEIRDVVALLRAWGRGETVAFPNPDEHLHRATDGLEHGDIEDAERHLADAASLASGEQLAAIDQALAALRAGDLTLAAEAIAQAEALAGEPGALAGDVTGGAAVFVDKCAVCHGADGTGGIGKNLHANAFVQSQGDAALTTFLLAGRRGTGMPAFEDVLTAEQVRDVIALLRTWQK